MTSRPVPLHAAPVSAGMIVAVPLELVASPLRNGKGGDETDRSALVIGGMEKIRAGGTVYQKVVAVTKAHVTRHAERDGQSLTIGKNRPLAERSTDGSVLRVPNTPGIRAVLGSAGTTDDSSAWPSVRLYPMSNCLTRSLLAMTWGPPRTDKTASEQCLLDAAMRDFPHVLSRDRVWAAGPARARHVGHCHCPKTMNYATSPKTEPPIKAETPNARALGHAPVLLVLTCGDGCESGHGGGVQ